MNSEMAEILALQGLGWLAGHEDGLERFLSLSGLDATSLRSRAGTTDMNIAVLDFLLAHEDLLLRFCETAPIEPRTLHLARYRLCGEA
jgi:hypothetical protein